MKKIQAKKLTPTAKMLVENIIYPLVSLGIVLAVWAIAAAVVNKAVLLPMPDEVFVKFFALFSESGFWKAVGGTLGRTLVSFAISFVLAFVFAAIGGLWKPFHRVLSPIVSILRSAPTMAVILIIMLWVNFQTAPKYIGFLIAFPLLYSAFYTAITGVDADLIEMTKLYRVRPWDKVTGLYLPSIADGVFDISGSTLSLTLKVIIAAEVLCYTVDSIGHNMQYAKLTFEISNLLAWTVLAIVMSMALELLVLGLKKLSAVTGNQMKHNITAPEINPEINDIDAQNGVKTDEIGIKNSVKTDENSVENMQKTDVNGVKNDLKTAEIDPENDTETTEKSGVYVKNLGVKYGEKIVFDALDVDFAEGKINVILGGSGVGKTTLLNALAGLKEHDGEVRGMEGGISYLFQKDRLIPSISVYKNLDLVLRAKIKDKRERKKLIADMLFKLEISDQAAKLSSKLSGGQAQRAAMARAFLYPSKVLLMDEPFRALDSALKLRLLALLSALNSVTPRTVIFVTHAIDECLLSADKFFVLGNSPATVVLDGEITTEQRERKLTNPALEETRLALLTALF